MSEEICDGVKMLIERMQSNPEDFEYGGKLHGYRNTMEEVLRCPPSDQPMWYLNETEKQALIKAYTDMHKQIFTTGVVQAILSPEPDYDINMDRPYASSAMRLDSSGNLGIGTQKPSKILTSKAMMQQAQQTLDEEFLKEYAKSNHTRP